MHPILLNKCISCHGGEKIKGALQLTSIETIKKGGKHGQQIENRIHLPIEDDRHMPPNDKMQLTKEDLQEGNAQHDLFIEWIYRIDLDYLTIAMSGWGMYKKFNALDIPSSNVIFGL